MFLYTKFHPNRLTVLQTNQLGWRVGQLFKFEQRSREKNYWSFYLCDYLTHLPTHLPTYLPPDCTY